MKGDEKKTRQRPGWARRSAEVGRGTAVDFAAVAATEVAPVMARALDDELVLEPEILALLTRFTLVPVIAAVGFRRTRTAGVPVLGTSGAVAATSRPHATNFTNAPPSVAAAAAISTGAECSPA